MKDYLYIIITSVTRILLKLLPHKSVQDNQIIFTSYLGKQYSCNPKYICEYLLTNAPEYKLIWAFQNPEKYSYLEKRGIQTVKYNSLEFIRLCLSSKYVITNVRDLFHIPFSKKQQIINTWHGGGAYKSVGTATATQNRAEHFRQTILKKTNLTFLSSSKAFTDMTIKESFHHYGPILECGMPRNDILIHASAPDVKEKVFQFYQIPQNNHILLYAPTYREDRKAKDYSFDTNAVRLALKERFGGNWSILIRTHYYVAEELKMDNPEDINASEYPDMQELLYSSDILITDYSSSIWDFSFTGRPCLLYATDLDDYHVAQGFYTDIHTWPFPLAENNQELINNICQFDEKKYQHDILQHHLDLGSYEEGEACKKVLEYIRCQK